MGIKNWLKIRRIKKARLLAINTLKEFVPIGIVNWSLILGEKKTPYSLVLLINGFNSRKLERPPILSQIRYAPAWAELQSKPDVINFLVDTSPHYMDLYWAKQPFPKPYWFGNYMLNGLLYDREFERQHDIDTMTSYLQTP